MATGVVRNLSEFKLPPFFQTPFFHPSLHHDLDFQDSSEDDDEFLEEDEVEELAEVDPPSNTSNEETADSQARADESESEMTIQLLKFSELINSDIQRYFGQKNKEDDPDSCNIYEDFHTPCLSGQEMYYQDLMKMAHSRHHDKGDSFSPLTPPTELDHKILKTICNKEDPKKLGPLSELFDFGLRRYTRQRAAGGSRGQRLDKKYGHIVPMHRRLLPQSFWREPSPAPSCILNTNTPDFSDLLENWTSDAGQEMQLNSRDLVSEFSR
ncbi:protein PERCC1 [Spea bombifrons]|uniref:protein PERCC1 n=1 Tax=Spea bombifrons TaxID=233779 RepID=UPI00234A5D71|nr:protein PERCC1 [Spea bombifrons]